MSELPGGWTLARLDQLLHSIEAGLNVKCEERAPTFGEAGLVKISAVTWGKFDEEASKTLPKEAVLNERNRIRTGDLLISRANTIELVGASVIVGPIGKRLYLSDKVLRLLVHEPSKRWINYALKSPDVRRAIQAASTGNQLSMRNIPQEKLRALTIPLAPQPEQTRIADQLDTLLARIQACQDRLDAIPALLKRFRQAVLNSAMRGELSEADRSPWDESTIGDIAVDLRYGTSKKCSYESGGHGVLRIPNIGRHGSIDTTDLKRAEFDSSEVQKLALQDGDLLVIRSNGSVELVGATGLVTEAEAGLLFAGYLMRLRVDSARTRPAFIRMWLAASTQRRLIEQTAKSTSGVNNLNAEELRSLPLRIPQLHEQDEIIRRVNALFQLADRIEARHAAARAQAQRLSPLTLAKAFRGELVPQDPNDEPASALLARIDKQRATASTTSAPKTRKPRQARAPKDSTAMSNKSRQDDDVKGQPYLAGHLRRLGQPVDAKTLYDASELPVADFYKQLAWEIAEGHVNDADPLLEPTRHAA